MNCFDYRCNPITPQRLMGVLTLAIWPSSDSASAAEAEVANKAATRFLAAIETTDLSELRAVLVRVLDGPAKQPGAMEKLRSIYRAAVGSNAVLPATLEMAAGVAPTPRDWTPPPPPPRPRSAPRAPRPSSTPPPSSAPPPRRARPRAQVGVVCIICGLDSRGRPLCRKHYYESVGKEFVEVCQFPGCGEPSRGQPLCRTHYYGTRKPRAGRRYRERPADMRSNPGMSISLSIQFPDPVGGASISVFRRSEKYLLSETDVQEALTRLAEDDEDDREEYLSLMDYIVCAIFPEIKSACFDYYAGYSPPMRELLSAKQIQQFDALILAVLKLVTLLEKSNSPLSWPDIRKQLLQYFASRRITAPTKEHWIAAGKIIQQKILNNATDG